MTKRFKKIAVICAVTTMASLLSTGVSAISGTAEISGAKITYSNIIYKTSANAKTNITGDNSGNRGSVSVSGSYSYVNTDTLIVTTTGSGDAGQGGASISFTAPKKCNSVKLVSNHSASYNGQNWSAPNVTNIR